MTAIVIFKFINEENKTAYKEKLLTWLEYDFLQQKEKFAPHWLNKNTILTSITDCNAIVAVNEHKKIIGCMTWCFYAGVAAEISFVGVLQEYQHRGVFTKILRTFSHKFTNICLLTATVPTQLEEIFSKSGWGFITDNNSHKKCFRILRPVLRQLDNMPKGHVIAVCSKPYAKVIANPNKYKPLTRYFRVKLDKDGKLHEPLVTSFMSNGYIGLYLNKELIAQGSPESLFETTEDTTKTAWAIQEIILVINRIASRDPKLLSEQWLSSSTQREDPSQAHSDNDSSRSILLHSPTTDSSDIEPHQDKKPRIEHNSAFFPSLPIALIEKKADLPIAQPIVTKSL